MGYRPSPNGRFMIGFTMLETYGSGDPLVQEIPIYTLQQTRATPAICTEI